MSNRNEDTAWVESSRKAIEILREPEAVSKKEAFEESILAAVARFDDRYRRNFEPDGVPQLPLAVFERLIEQLLPVAATAASPSLYRQLKKLAEDTFGRANLLEEVRAALLVELNTHLAASAEDSDLYVARGALQVDARELEAAKSDFAMAVQLAPENLEARRQQIRVMLQERNDEEALEQLNVLLLRSPADEFGLLERARLWLRFFYVQEALGDLERLVEVTQDEEALLFASKQFLYVGRFADAAKIGRRLESSAEGQLVLGKALLDLGEGDEAISVLERTLTLVLGKESLQRFASAKVNALKLLGDAYFHGGDGRRALASYVEAMGSASSTYELVRAVTKLAWDELANAKEGSPTGGLQSSEAKWIEPNMEATFVDGVPVEVRSADLQQAPYLERLPWTKVVEKLDVGVGRRDNREAFTQLFQLEFPQLRSLELQAEHFGFPCLFRLVEAAFFERLERLTLQECDLDFAALCLLLERAPQEIRELRVLVADARPKLPRAVTLEDLLRRWERPALQVLELGDCALSCEEVLALTEAKLPQLRTLGLTGNDLQGLPIDRFLDSALVGQLHELRIGHSGVEFDLLLGIFERIDTLSIVRVRVQREWTETELHTIHAHPASKKLALLELGVSTIEDESWVALLD